MKNKASVLQSSAVADLNQIVIELAPSSGEVATKAYFNYLNQGSLPGHDVRHWLEAEAQLLAESQLITSPKPHVQDNIVCDTGIKSACPNENQDAGGRQTTHDTQKLFRICALL
jgi:hypothetical protein